MANYRQAFTSLDMANTISAVPSVPCLGTKADLVLFGESRAINIVETLSFNFSGLHNVEKECSGCVQRGGELSSSAQTEEVTPLVLAHTTNVTYSIDTI